MKEATAKRKERKVRGRKRREKEKEKEEKKRDEEKGGESRISLTPSFPHLSSSSLSDSQATAF